MKFELHAYWKHQNCIDVFFDVLKARFDRATKNVIVTGTWCIQGTKNWWLAVDDRFAITPDQYKMWQRYMPKGTPRI